MAHQAPAILDAIKGASMADLEAINARVDELRAELDTLLQARSVLYTRLGQKVPTKPPAYAGEVPIETENAKGHALKDGTAWAGRNRGPANMAARFRPSDKAAEYLEQIGEPATAEAIATALDLPTRSMAIALARDTTRFKRMPSGKYELVTD